MSQKLAFRPDEAAEVLGSRELLENCRRAGWLVPSLQSHKLTLYDYSDLVKCWRRIRDEGGPASRQRTKKDSSK